MVPILESQSAPRRCVGNGSMVAGPILRAQDSPKCLSFALGAPLESILDPKPSKTLRWRWFDGRQSHSESSRHPKVPQRSFKRLGKCHKTPSETLNKPPTAFREPSKMPQGLPKTPGIIPKSYMPKAKIPNPKSELPNSQISQSTPTS